MRLNRPGTSPRRTSRHHRHLRTVWVAALAWRFFRYRIQQFAGSRDDGLADKLSRSVCAWNFPRLVAFGDGHAEKKKL
jgi:hypothetical protein